MGPSYTTFAAGLFPSLVLSPSGPRRHLFGVAKTEHGKRNVLETQCVGVSTAGIMRYYRNITASQHHSISLLADDFDYWSSTTAC